MNEDRTLFTQLMGELPKYEFNKCVRRYRRDYRVRSLSSYGQFLVMCFAQLTCRESLRDIETCLRALGSKLYHSGIGHPLSLAIGLVGARRTIHQAEHGSRPSGDVGNGSRPESALRRRSDPRR